MLVSSNRFQSMHSEKEKHLATQNLVGGPWERNDSLILANQHPIA